MISIKHRLFLPAAIALTITACFLSTGCSGYIVTEEEETPSTVIGSDVPYQIVITLESDKRTMPFYPGDTITIYWAGSDTISSLCLELYREDSRPCHFRALRMFFLPRGARQCFLSWLKPSSPSAHFSRATFC